MCLKVLLKSRNGGDQPINHSWKLHDS